MSHAIGIYIDWDKDGSFYTAGDDISAYWQSADIITGFTSPHDLTRRAADVGTLVITVNNEDRRFSPLYAGGAYYGKLLPGLPVWVTVDGETMFTGYTVSFTPESGVRGGRQAVIQCQDVLGRLQNYELSLPLQETVRAEDLVRMVAAGALDGTARVVQLSFCRNPSDGDTMTFRLYDALEAYTDQVYTFKTSLSSATAGGVLIGASKEASAVNLTAAINTAQPASGTANYASGTPKNGIFAAADGGSTVYAGGTQTISASGNSEPVGAVAQRFEISDPGVLSQFKVTWAANTGSPSGTVTWIFTPHHPSEHDIIDSAGNPQPLPDASTYSTGTFTPTASATDTVNVTGGIFLQEFDGSLYNYYYLIVYYTGADNYNWQGSADARANALHRTGSAASGFSWVNSDTPANMACEVTTSGVTTADVDLTALAKGAWCNEWGSGRGVQITHLGGDTFDTETTAGADGSWLELEIGRLVLASAAETWGDGVNALSALSDIAASEHGYLWVDKNGLLTLVNRDWWFQRYVATSVLSMTDEQQSLDAGLTSDDVINDVTVRWRPRAELTSGTIIEASGPIEVPGKWGKFRYTGVNPPIKDPAGGSVNVRIPAKSSSGEKLGIKSLVLPPTAGTNFTLSDFRNDNPAAHNYTNSGYVTIGAIINGGNVELSFVNTAGGSLWVKDLYLTGVGLTLEDEQTALVADSTSITAYGRRTLEHTLPFPAVQSMARELAEYLLLRLKSAVFRVRAVTVNANRTFGGINPAAVEIGDIITLTETQTGISAQKLCVLGISASYDVHGAATISWMVEQIESLVYGIYGTTTYDNCVYAL